MNPKPTPRPLPPAIKTLYPFKPNFAPTPGGWMHYLDEGTGEPVVMVHGNPTWSFFFRRLVTGLSKYFRMIAPDHIGCGRSEKPTEKTYGFSLTERVADFSAFIRHLALKQPLTLVIHDWGGMIAMAWAVNHPEKVRRVVVLNTAAFPPPAGKPLPWQLALLRNVPFIARPAVLGGNLFSLGARYLAPSRPMPKTVRRGYAFPYNCPRNRLATLKFVQTIPLDPKDAGYTIVANTAERLYRLQDKPFLILWGKNDFVFDPDYLKEWQRRFPDAVSRLLPSAGHYLLEDEPDFILTGIRNFLDFR